MKKIKMSNGPWVKMKYGSYKYCDIRLVYQWERVSSDGKIKDDMGVIVLQPKEPKDSHLFTKTVKLDELDFIAFR